MAPPRKKDGCIDWAGIYEKGENPNGMMAQTADATVRNHDGLGPQEYHYHQRADGERWNDGFQPDAGFFGINTSAAAQPSRRKRRK